MFFKIGVFKNISKRLPLYYSNDVRGNECSNNEQLQLVNWCCKAYGVLATPMDQYGVLATSMDHYGVLATPMDHYGILATPMMDHYGVLATPMDQYGVLATPMDQYIPEFGLS